ncbi:MAG: glycosyltransferase family 39 protein [Planctomycetes bacterium]|nr:glycosyltransferase family 39 protein [Planctomycetota bacterium]
MAAARGELVLDEIWSWELAANCSRAVQVFFLQLDNNHIINTLVMYALGPLAEPFSYRLPAVLASTVGLIFGYLLGRKRGAGLPVLLLLSFSYVLILYGSEARGYAYLTGFTLAAWWFLEEFLERPRFWWRVGFAVTCTLGFLSQLPFAFAYAGFFVYSAIKLYQKRHWMQALLMLHLWPTLAILAVYLFYVDGLVKGGGEKLELGQTVLAAFSLVVGGPQLAPWAYASAAVSLVLIVAACLAEFKHDTARGLLVTVAMFVAPAGVIAASGFQFVYPRHFLVPMIFAYVTSGCLLAAWWRRGKVGRSAVVLLLGAFCLLNALPVARLVIGTRSPDADAFRWVAEHSPQGPITISGDHNFRVGRPLIYFFVRHGAELKQQGKLLTFVDNTEVPAEGTDWLLRHTPSEWDLPHDSTTVDTKQNRYVLRQVFPATSLSGFGWWIYQREATETAEPE